MVCSRKRLLSVAMALLVIGTGSAWGQGDPLKSGFENPPNGARPRVWWHWMNGNITPEGITADLEWMHRVGLGGYQNFDAALQTPQVVPKRLAYMTPEWKEASRSAECSRIHHRIPVPFRTSASTMNSPRWARRPSCRNITPTRPS